MSASVSVKIMISKPSEFILEAEVSIPDIDHTEGEDLDYCRGILDWSGELVKSLLGAK